MTRTKPVLSPTDSHKKSLSLSKKELSILKKVLSPNLLPYISAIVDDGEIKALLKLADRIGNL